MGQDGRVYHSTGMLMEQGAHMVPYCYSGWLLEQNYSQTMTKAPFDLLTSMQSMFQMHIFDFMK